VKDPSVLTSQQQFSRLYRACVRRHHLLNVVRLRTAAANHKNFFEEVEKTRKKFEKAKNFSGKNMRIS
jgi:hypothetical protein